MDHHATVGEIARVLAVKPHRREAAVRAIVLRKIGTHGGDHYASARAWNAKVLLGHRSAEDALTHAKELRWSASQERDPKIRDRKRDNAFMIDQLVAHFGLESCSPTDQVDVPPYSIQGLELRMAPICVKVKQRCRFVHLAYSKNGDSAEAARTRRIVGQLLWTTIHPVYAVQKGDVFVHNVRNGEKVHGRDVSSELSAELETVALTYCRVMSELARSS